MVSVQVLERIAFLCRVEINDFSKLCAATDATDKLNTLQQFASGQENQGRIREIPGRVLHFLDKWGIMKPFTDVFPVSAARTQDARPPYGVSQA